VKGNLVFLMSTCVDCFALQHARNLAQPYTRASYAGPFNVSDVGAAHYHVTTSGGDLDDSISIKSYPAAAAKTPRRSAKTVDIEVYMCVSFAENLRVN